MDKDTKFKPVVFLQSVENLPPATYKMEHRFQNVIAGRTFPDLDVHISYDKTHETIYYVTKCPAEFFERGKRLKFDQGSFHPFQPDAPNWTELCGRGGTGGSTPVPTRACGCGRTARTACSSAGTSVASTSCPPRSVGPHRPRAGPRLRGPQCLPPASSEGGRQGPPATLHS